MCISLEFNKTVMTPYYFPEQEPFYCLKTFASVRPDNRVVVYRIRKDNHDRFRFQSETYLDYNRTLYVS